MVLATPRAPLAPLARPKHPHPAPCCLTSAHDAYHLARAAVAMARPGLVVDVGCGAGGVAIPLLAARSDVRVAGIEVDRQAAHAASRRAALAGVGDRLAITVGDALAIALPGAHSVVVNPPLLPTEPWFTVPRRDGPPELFAQALLRRFAAHRQTTDVWLHLFDFAGIDAPADGTPSLAETAAGLGFEMGFPHRGWRAVGPTSAIRQALPELGRLYPDAVAWTDGRERRFVDLSPAGAGELLIRHSIVRLYRPAVPAGDPR